MRHICFLVWVCLVALGSQAQARSFTSLAEEQAYIVGEKARETMECIQRHLQGAELDRSEFNRALAEQIASLSSIGPVLADARLFGRDQDRSLDNLRQVDAAGQVQLALGALVAVYLNEDTDPVIRQGAHSALLIHAVKATAERCELPAQLVIVRAEAISLLNGSNEVMEFDGTNKTMGGGDCKRPGLNAEVLTRGRSIVEDVELTHADFVRLIRSRQEAGIDVICVRLFSEMGGVPLERVLALTDLGVHISWNRVP
jgi:hypothetical protein